MAIVPNSGGGPVDVHISTPPTLYGADAVTPSDTADLPRPGTEYLMATGAGTVKVTFTTGEVDTITLPANVWTRANVKRVWAGGTTATGIIAGY